MQNELQKQIIGKIRAEKMIVILRGITPDRILPTVEAVLKGGVSLLEITFDHASEEKRCETPAMIAAVRKSFGDRVSLGAGTVLTVGDVDDAAGAGAAFMISPDTNVDVIRHTVKRGLVSIPGAYTPSEITRAYEAGADFVKLFPLTGDAAAYIKAVRAPLGFIPMLAVGGVNLDNVAQIMTTGVCGIGISSGVVKAAEVASFTSDADYAVITERVRRYQQCLNANT